MDEAWASIETADRTGFRGLCSSGITVADCDAANFSVGGYQRRFTQDGQVSYVVEDSDVVGFLSRPEDSDGAHSAILTFSDSAGALCAARRPIPHAASHTLADTWTRRAPRCLSRRDCAGLAARPTLYFG